MKEFYWEKRRFYELLSGYFAPVRLSFLIVYEHHNYLGRRDLENRIMKGTDPEKAPNSLFTSFPSKRDWYSHIFWLGRNKNNTLFNKIIREWSSWREIFIWIFKQIWKYFKSIYGWRILINSISDLLSNWIRVDRDGLAWIEKCGICEAFIEIVHSVQEKGIISVMACFVNNETNLKTKLKKHPQNMINFLFYFLFTCVALSL